MNYVVWMITVTYLRTSGFTTEKECNRNCKLHL